MQPQYESPGPLLQITPRERRALQLLADGDTASQVSIGLGLSAAETEALLSRVFAAMGVATRADAVASAERRGLLEREQTASAPQDGPGNDLEFVSASTVTPN
jgi:DNA-binding CsgD family transcriptional regulator